MSRLDLVIQRLLAQRACIEQAVRLVRDLPGPILELGLGNGRSYDHLRERCPGRAIFVFDRELASHPASRPEVALFIQGDFRDTLPTAGARIGAPAAIAHCDIGSHDPVKSRAMGVTIAPLVVPLMAPSGIVLGDQPMPHPALRRFELPEGAAPGSYHIYQVVSP